MAVPLSYNVRSVIARPWATIATAVGIGLVVAILVLAFSLANGFQHALVDTGSPDNVLVIRKGAGTELSSGVSRDAANDVRGLPDVAIGPDGHPLVSPEVLVLINAERNNGTGTSNVSVRGVDREGMALRSVVHIYAGRDVSPGAAEVIVGKRVAQRFNGFGVGSRVKLSQREFLVVGQFDAGGTAFESEIWGDNKVLMPVFRGDVFQSVTFRMKDPARFAAIKHEIETDPRHPLDVKRESDYYTDQSNGLAIAMRVMGSIIVSIMAVGALFAAMNTMFAAVGSRTREIATLLTLGFSPWAVMTSFVFESVLIALVGGVIGCLLALPVNGIATSTTNFATFSEVAFAFRITPDVLAYGIVFALVLGFVGGILPAWKAARQPLASGMRAL
jgi:putative ABC transport system permease protein